MGEPRYEYDNLKVNPPKVDDGWYLVKDGVTYRVDVPIGKMHFTKSINILTGEVHYPSNADRIRAMDDEELANWLGVYCNGQTAQEVGKPCVNGFGSCEECWLDWLKQEVSE